jgi:hypothetical protein
MSGGSGGIPKEAESIYYCEGLSKSGASCDNNIDIRGLLDAADIFKDPNYINYIELDPIPQFDSQLFDFGNAFDDILKNEPGLYELLLLNSTMLEDIFIRNNRPPSPMNQEVV